MYRHLSIPVASWFVLPLYAVAERIGGSVLSSQAYSSVELPVFPGEGKVDSTYPLALQTFFAQNNRLPRDEVMRLLEAASKQVKKEPGIKEVDIPDGSGHMNVIGDLHGQIHELLSIFEAAGQPSETNPYLFNGDFVDRGSYAVEVVLILLAWKQAFPHHVHLNRGSHEYMDEDDGFRMEVVKKYGGPRTHDGPDQLGPKLYDAFFLIVFRYLPVATVISKRVFVCHGGLPTKPEDQQLWRMKRNIKPVFSIVDPDDGFEMALMWNHPRPIHGARTSPVRGEGVFEFGQDVTKKFLETNNLSLVIRSHEFRSGGISLDHDLSDATGGKLLGLMTVFSAASYSDAFDNLGGIIKVSVNDGKVAVENVTFVARRPEGYIKSFYYLTDGVTTRTTTTTTTTTTTEAKKRGLLSRFAHKVARAFACSSKGCKG